MIVGNNSKLFFPSSVASLFIYHKTPLMSYFSENTQLIKASGKKISDEEFLPAEMSWIISQLTVFRTGYIPV